MSKASFVYVTYIQSTPERVWQALQDPEMTRDYWGRHRNESDWTAGSSWRHGDYDDATKVSIEGQVVEIVPPRRLVLTWAEPGKPEQASRVTFEIEEAYGAVRLTVTHDDLMPDLPMLRGISAGWPAVLSSLKTMLETGAAMPMTRRQWGRGGAETEAGA